MPAATPKKRKSKTTKRKTPAKHTTTVKNEPDSFLKAVQELIANKPDADSGHDLIFKFLERAWGLFFRGTHQSFLIAWNVGGILAIIRDRCAHGGSKEAKAGAMTWPQYVSGAIREHVGFCKARDGGKQRKVLRPVRSGLGSREKKSRLPFFVAPY